MVVTETDDGRRGYPCTWRFIWTWGAAGLLWSVLAGLIWPAFILQPKFDAHLLSKANATRGPTSPSLYFFPITYNNQSLPFVDFSLTNLQLESCVCLPVSPVLLIPRFRWT